MIDALEEHLRDLNSRSLDDEPYEGLCDISDRYLDFSDLTDIADGMFGSEGQR